MGSWTIPTNYSWAHLHSQHRLWSQTPGEGMASCIFRSYPGREGRCGDIDKTWAERPSVVPSELDGCFTAAMSRRREGSACVLCICTKQQLRSSWSLWVVYKTGVFLTIDFTCVCHFPLNCLIQKLSWDWMNHCFPGSLEYESVLNMRACQDVGSLNK